MIELACPHCGKELKIADNFAGKAGACKSCGGKIHVPEEFDVNQIITPLNLEEGFDGNWDEESESLFLKTVPKKKSDG